MMPHVTRRLFMAAAPVALLGATSAQPAEEPAANPVDDLYPTTPSSRAAAFVGACHAKLDVVNTMLAEDAGLAKASWDWGFGDWETAIGAASHTGRTDIIEVLIAHGARPTLFTLATLDRIDALRDLIENVPGVESLEGPHSISLYRHALAGEAQRVIDYLEARGATNTNHFACSEADAAAYLGEYVWGTGEADRFVVAWKKETLSITRPGQSSRNLMLLGDHAFSPAGARHVRIEFDIADGQAVRVDVPWQGQTLTARRP